MTQFVVYIHDGSPIQEVSSSNARRSFAEFGYEVVELSVHDAHAESKLKALLRDRKHELLCFCSSNSWALNIRNGDSLLHTITGIPLVILIQDHPVYLLHTISPSLNGAVFFVPGDETADFVAKHYGLVATTLVVNPGFLATTEREWSAPEREAFASRSAFGGR